jgi:dihydrolipoamide dehydrogenase
VSFSRTHFNLPRSQNHAKIATLSGMNLKDQNEKINESMNAPTTLPLIEEIVELETELDITLDPENIIEAAEQLLREGAPHDFDVLVIGAGPAGLAAAQSAAQSGLHTAIIEGDEVGGVCLHRGCIPTKTLLESIGVLRLLRRARTFGIDSSGQFSPDFTAMQLRKTEVVARLREQTSAMLETAGVEVIRGQARFVEEHTVEVENSGQVRRIAAVHIVIASGGKPARLLLPGTELPGVITSDDILEQTIIPKSLVVVGAGAIGVEFASIFAELGTHVTIIEKKEHVLPGEDEDIQMEMERSLNEIGVSLQMQTSIARIQAHNGSLRIVFEQDTKETSLKETSIEADQVLLTTGRIGNIEGLNLEAVGIKTEGNQITVDEDKETSVSGVYAVGDCIRRVGWAHQAAMEGREVAATIAGLKSEIDARFVPSCYFTFPEVASVGLTLKDAQALGIEATAGRFPFRFNGRAAISGSNEGFVKLVIEIGTTRLLGCQIIGPHATEIINEVSLALRSGATAEAFTDALYAHPTFAEVLPGAARAALSSLPE